MAAESKLLTMRDAIASHVPSGSMVLLGAQLEQMIPFAAGHELIRQSRRDLTLVGPISDILFDQLIGAGCVSRVMAAWVGNVSAGVGYCFRRAVERSIPRRLEVVDYSNFTLALALHAGALGVPFLHVQRSDAQGNAHIWGSLGVAVDGARAARKVIVVAEEIVEPSVITSDPNRTLIPGFLVAAVVHEPGGAHPSPVQGYYGRDHAFFTEYHEQTRRLEDFEDWLARWIMHVTDRTEYWKHLGASRVEALAGKEHAFSAPADFGY